MSEQEMTAIQVTDKGDVLGAEETSTLKKSASAPAAPAATATAPMTMMMGGSVLTLVFITFVLVIVNIGSDRMMNNQLGKKISNKLDSISAQIDTVSAFQYSEVGIALDLDTNYCSGAKVDLANFNCTQAVIDGVEQSGANVTEGYEGLINANSTPPITTPYYQAGLCPVNVHWHLGAEHLSVGEYDEHGKGPYDSYAIYDGEGATEVDSYRRKLGAGGVRIGYQCQYYDDSDSKYTEAYDWQHCTDMVVGQTYEIHWPHSTVGACGTPYQYQTPFYDGVFCNYAAMAPNGTTTHNNVGVQSQTFTVVNDENYYYPDLIKGMMVAGDYGSDIAYYTGSTTGTSRDNDICSAYSPITWQVDRKCHLISASSFDKMCADMKAQVDDMSDDLYAHGARLLVSDELAAKQVV